MSSIKFIMDLDVDQDTTTHDNKKVIRSFDTPSASRAQDPSAHQGYVSTPLHVNNTRMTPSSLPALPSTTASIRPLAVTTDFLPSLPQDHRDYRPAFIDPLHSPGVAPSPALSMVSPRSATMNSNRRGGIGRPGSIRVDTNQASHHMLVRPIRTPQSADSPIRLTPITGRPSRAKKGQPVHVCDVCRPAKTFTRAEHLRRHQLGHGTPQFPCNYPGCDRAFHRPDLLSRHQQKHQGGEHALPLQQRDNGGQGSPQPLAMPEDPSRLPLRPPAPPSAASGSGSGSGFGPSTPVSSNEVPSTPHIANTMLHSSLGSSPMRPDSSGISPNQMARRPSYDASNYVLSTSARENPILQYPTDSASFPRLTTSAMATGIGYHQPRSPHNLVVVTQGLGGPQRTSLHVPDLVSPLGASSTDGSTFSTPVSDSRLPYAPWIPRGASPATELISPYSVSSAHERGSIETPYLITQFPQTPHHALMSPHHLLYPTHPGSSFGILDVSMAAFPRGDHSEPLQQALEADRVQPADMHQGAAATRNSFHSLYPMRSPSPITTSAETLVTPSTALPSDHVGFMAGFGRQKEMAMTGGHMSMELGLCEAPSMTSSAIGLSGGPGDGSPPGGSFLMHQGLGECASGPIQVTSPLPRPVRTPEYLDAYWSRFNTEYPVVHRRLSQEAGQDVLRCAMAAIGAQLLDGKDDRTRSNILHEHAWEEVKRIPSWNLQVMQTILLCEFVSRFRGRRLVTRPSKLFESLYSRVSSLQFLGQSLEDSCVVPGSSGRLSSVSSSFSDSSLSSWYSCSEDTPTSLHHMEFGFTPKHHLSFGSPSFSAQHLLASPFNPVGPPSANPFLGNQYLEYLQAINEVSSLFEPAPTAQSRPDLTAEQRWRAWLELEARRRLLGACFFIDVHTSMYHQHPRTREYDLSGPGNVPPIPLVGRSSALWAAETAEDWDALLTVDPDVGVPKFLSRPDSLNPMVPDQGGLGGCEGQPMNVFDRMATLASEISRLPRRNLSGRESSSQDINTPIALMGESSQGSPWNVPKNNAAIGPDGHATAGFQTEERISHLFPGCPVTNTYLALHHTPLRDLLAVCGDTCVTSQQKIAATASMPLYQRRVSAWTETPSSMTPDVVLRKSATRALVYAARGLNNFFRPSDNNSRVVVCGFSDYWALYVCALICWAVGHRGGNADDSEEATLEWLHTLASVHPDNTSNIWSLIRNGRGVVGLVRRRLELEFVGGRNDPRGGVVTVLQNLEDGVGWPWF